MLIINKHFNFCCFRALAYTTLDRLCAVFLYNLYNCLKFVAVVFDVYRVNVPFIPRLLSNVPFVIYLFVLPNKSTERYSLWREIVDEYVRN